MVPKINIREALSLDKVQFIDVRSPAEFEEDHIPGAINVPILDDNERAIVGTIYKQVSQEKAITEGRKFYEQKIPLILDAVKPYAQKILVVYCWRGGMRSEVVSTLFNTLKYSTLRLEGGYKSYRKYLMERLSTYDLKPKLIVLHGLTGCGKTQLIQKLSPALDLEGLAQHRGSLYGALSLKPHSQKKFETLLLQQLDSLNSNNYFFIEGESRKIGDVQIPEFLWKAMKKGIKVKVTRSLDLRAREAVKEYFIPQNIDPICQITLSLQKIISRKNKQLIVDLIKQNNYLDAAKLLLTEYYDQLYSYSLEKINYDWEINNDVVEKAVIDLQQKVNLRFLPNDL